MTVVYKTACACVLSRIWLFETLWTVAHQDPLSMWFSRQGYWSGLPCPPPEDLLNPRIKPESLTLQVDSLPLSHWGRPENSTNVNKCKILKTETILLQKVSVLFQVVGWHGVGAIIRLRLKINKSNTNETEGRAQEAFNKPLTSAWFWTARSLKT